MAGFRSETGGAGRAAAGAVAFLGVLAGVYASPPEASAGASRCEGPEVLLVHDLAGTGADWDLLAEDLRRAGWCPVVHEWGRPRPGDVPLPVGGLTGVEAAAGELVRARGWTPPGPEETPTGRGGTSTGQDGTPPGHGGKEPVSVVARGVGALVVQRALQMSGGGAGPVEALVTLGPVWNGTNLMGIADVEDLSRRLGTFDAILAWERTWMDPLCEGCREAVRGSETLTTLHREGIRTPGVAYTDIVSVTDLLVQPPLEQSPPGTDLRVVEPRGGTVPVWHGELGRDPVSRALVLDVLGPT